VLAVFVVETNSRNKSDFLYVKKYLDTFFESGSNVVRPIYLGGKDKYEDASRVREINSLVSKYLSVDREDKRIVVFYCMDTDDISRGPDASLNRKKAQEIEQFCKRKGYEFIWFHEVIEQTFVGKRVSDNEKGKAAVQFVKRNLCNLDRTKLRCDSYSECRPGTSNIDAVLSRYFMGKSA
jgi:hypothetical protein